MTIKDVWDVTLTKLKENIPQTALELWIEPLKPVAYSQDAIVLLASSPFQKDVVMSKYKDVISGVLSETVGFEISINVQTTDEYKTSVPVEVPPSPGIEQMNTITKNMSHPDYTFENFIVGDSNRHAHAACLAVAQNPSGAYNPLFLHGPTGLGKTHLLFAIQNEIQQRFPGKKTAYVTSEDFVMEMTENLQRHTMTEFKQKYRSLDVLMVDDIQFIAGKESLQNEFFHTFNALHEANKQIILASDRPPRDIQYLDDRLRSRFEMGLITDISQPEYELKAAIIRQRCEFYGMTLSSDLVSFIAQHVKSNIRQIEGVLKKMLAYQTLSHTELNLAIAQSAIRDITNENQPLPVIIDNILMEVAREFDVTIDDLCSTKRTAQIKDARHVAMYIMRELTPMSQPEIGKQFSDRDHSTVHHATSRIAERMNTNPAFKLRIEDLIKTIKEK